MFCTEKMVRCIDIIMPFWLFKLSETECQCFAFCVNSSILYSVFKFIYTFEVGYWILNIRNDFVHSGFVEMINIIWLNKAAINSDCHVQSGNGKCDSFVMFSILYWIAAGKQETSEQELFLQNLLQGGNTMNKDPEEKNTEHRRDGEGIWRYTWWISCIYG